MAFDGKQLRDASIVTAKIANAAIDDTKLATDSVIAIKIAANAVTNAKLATNSVTTAKIADSNVTTIKIADAAITSVKIGTGEVQRGNIANLAVNTNQLEDQSVTTGKLDASPGSEAVDTSVIRDLAVTSAKLADNAVTTVKINNGAVTSAKIDSTYEATLFLKNGSRAMTGALDLGTTNKIVNLADPTQAQDAATKSYVDAVATSLDLKASVKFATTANIALDGSVTTVDGVTVVTGQRALVKNQSTASQNGIYVTSTTAAWTRATDADSNVEVTSGMFAFVEEGLVNGNTGWVLTTDNPITLNTTALAFTQFSGAGTYTAGFGLTLSGTQFNVAFENTNGAIQPVGTQSAGSSNNVARADHVHAHGDQAGGTLHALATAATAATNTATNDDGTRGFVSPDVVLKSNASPFGYQGKATGDVDLNSHKIINLTNPTAAQDAATKNYVDSQVSSATNAANGNKSMVGEITTADAQLATVTTLALTPKGYVQVFVNGIKAKLAGDKTSGDCYFSGNSGSTARALGSAVAGDELYWNGSVAGYQLDANDFLDFDYIH